MSTDPQTAAEADADTVASRAAQVIASMGADIRALTGERDRYRTAWRSARERAQAYGEGILRVVKDREQCQEWLRQAEERAAAPVADPQTDRPRALHLLEAADFLRDAHFRDGLSMQEAITALRHMADEVDPMAGSLARDGFGLDEIAAMPAAPVAAPPTGQADEELPDRLEAALTARFTELGNPFSRMRIAFQGPDGWPASKEVGPHDVAEVLRELLAAEPAAPPAPADRAALVERIAAVMREHYLCTDRNEADADGNLSCRCGDWREPGAEVDDENDWDSHLADAVLPLLPATDEPHRLTLSTALGLGTSAPWDAIRERAAELAGQGGAGDRAAVLREAADAIAAVIERDRAYSPRRSNDRAALGGAREIVLGLIDKPSRLAAETPGPETQGVRHAPGTAILCPDCRAKGHSICMDDEPKETTPAVPQCDGCGHLVHRARKCPAVRYGERCECDEPLAVAEPGKENDRG